MGNREEAVVYLRRAAERWRPDGLILPFATCSFALGGLVEEMLETEYPDRVERLEEQFGMGRLTLRDTFFREELPPNLTVRKREIAGLAAEGLHNNEIARRLFVSEGN